VISLLAEGLDFVAATDHNHVTDYAPAVSALEAGAGIRTAPGVEITTSAWGHFNAYPLPPGTPAPPYSGVDPPAIFAAVRSAAPGAVIQVNHPRMGEIGYFNRAGLEAEKKDGYSSDFDVIEVHNGFEHDDRATIDRNIADWFRLLNLGRHYTAVGNSDSHQLVLQWAGYPRSYVRLDDERVLTPTDVAEALRRGRAFVTSGPFIDLKVEGGQIGDLVRARNGRVSVELGVRAAPWLDVRRARVVANGATVRELAAESERSSATVLAQSFELALERDSWIVVLVEGDHANDQVLPGWHLPPLAFTNPVFVDVDGNGAFEAPQAVSAPPDAGVSTPGP